MAESRPEESDDDDLEINLKNVLDPPEPVLPLTFSNRHLQRDSMPSQLYFPKGSPEIPGFEALRTSSDAFYSCDDKVRYGISQDEFREANERLVELAGGPENVEIVFWELVKDNKEHAKQAINSATPLVHLCSKLLRRNEDSACVFAQISALIKIYQNQDVNKLFVKNEQDASALDYALLTNKIYVAKYLSMLYFLNGKDVNAKNDKGHTILHLAARRGDSCSQTLEELLKIRIYDCKSRSKHLYDLQVLNDGGKTPLDVAVACQKMFPEEETNTSYTSTIEILTKADLQRLSSNWSLFE